MAFELTKRRKKRFSLALKKIKYACYRPENERIVYQEVPYFSQWESSELAKDFLSGKIKATDDPNWKDSGAKKREEYALWSWNGCGMACLKMVLAHKLGKNYPLVTLAKRCMRYGGYGQPQGDDIPGLFYRPFLRFIKHEFNLDGEYYSYMVWEEIIRGMEEGSFVISSVHNSIRDPEATPQEQGGHLVLLVGYDWGKKLFYLHNPSGTTAENQAYAEISFSDFEKFFAHRGIIIL